MGDKGKKNEVLTRSVRDGIQASLEYAEAEHKRELFRRRLEVARSGLQAYNHGAIKEAVRAFNIYLDIIETWKKAPLGKVTPSHFNIKTDIPELLLISGVYWSMAKIYDRINTPEGQKEFHRYLNQFIIFSKGMPYQALSSETMRKYIKQNVSIHKPELKAAYKQIAVSNCFVATGLVDCVGDQTVERLRFFRDSKLTKLGVGRKFISIYYKLGPAWSNRVDLWPQIFRKALAKVLDAGAWILSLM